jgi:hypothetical protein
MFNVFSKPNSYKIQTIKIDNTDVKMAPYSFYATYNLFSEKGSRGSGVIESRLCSALIAVTQRSFNPLKAPKHGAQERKRDTELLSSLLAHV